MRIETEDRIMAVALIMMVTGAATTFLGIGALALGEAFVKFRSVGKADSSGAACVDRAESDHRVAAGLDGADWRIIRQSKPGGKAGPAQRGVADAHGVPVMAAPSTLSEYMAMWRSLDNGDTVVFDDWSGGGRLHRDLQLISAGMTTKWRRTGTCDKVDEFHPNGWIVVALRSSAREVDLGALRDKCEFLMARNRTGG